MTRRTFSPRLLSAFRFFQEHAGMIVGENAKSALALARAELLARDADVVFLWEGDIEADWSFVETWPEADQKRWHSDEHFAEYVRLVRLCEEDSKYYHDRAACPHAETLASLGGIIDADTNYRRVVEAELALEAFDALTLDAERAA